MSGIYHGRDVGFDVLYLVSFCWCEWFCGRCVSLLLMFVVQGEDDRVRLQRHFRANQRTMVSERHQSRDIYSFVVVYALIEVFKWTFTGS